MLATQPAEKAPQTRDSQALDLPWVSTALRRKSNHLASAASPCSAGYWTNSGQSCYWDHPSLCLPKSALFPTLSQALGTLLMAAIVLVGLELMAAEALLVALSASSLRFLKSPCLAWGLL